MLFSGGSICQRGMILQRLVASRGVGVGLVVGEEVPPSGINFAAVLEVLLVQLVDEPFICTKRMSRGFRCHAGSFCSSH